MENRSIKFPFGDTDIIRKESETSELKEFLMWFTPQFYWGRITVDRDPGNLINFSFVICRTPKDPKNDTIFRCNYHLEINDIFRLSSGDIITLEKIEKDGVIIGFKKANVII